MNILQILPELHYGGVETGTVDFAKYLINHNHKAVVVSAGGGLVDTVKSFGAIHYALEVNKKSLFSIIKAATELIRIIQKENIEIVHARSRVPAWIAYFACRRAQVPFITTCHGYYSRHLFSQVMGWGKFVIAPSNVIGRHMIDDFGVAYEKIRNIPRSVDIEKFTFKPPETKSRTEFIIALIARITPLKGHVYFIKALQKVYRSMPNIRAWVVGSASKGRLHYKEELGLLAKRLGLSHIVEFLGKRSDIPEILSKINLLVLATTTHEAFGRVIIEAQAAGVPVVATRVGGVVDIIDDGVDGILVSPSDPENMAEGIIKLLKDLELSQALAKNGRLKVLSQFTLEKMAEKTLEVYREAIASKRILIIKISALGDVILSIPALRAIRKKYPAPSVIMCVVGKDVASILTRCPYIDELIIYDFKDRDKGFLNLLKLGKELRRKGFDLAIDLQNNRRSHILCALSNVGQRYGYRNRKFGFLLNKTMREDGFILGPIEHQFRILKMLGIELKDREIELWPSKEDARYVDRFLESAWLNQGQGLVGIHLGSSKRWLTKRWPLEYIGHISETLALKDIRVVVTGEPQTDPQELKILQEITRKSRPIIACGKTTINQLACLIKRCSVFVAGDTAPLHIAIGMGTAVVALFGPTDPRRHTSSNENIALISKELPCQPCYKRQCVSVDCMKQISVEEVEAAIFELLRRQKAPLFKAGMNGFLSRSSDRVKRASELI
jgi:lipopolysaccharide heptosyltransferase II